MADLANSPKPGGSGGASSPGEGEGPKARVGQLIKGKWTIDSLLGVGGMAAVYAASHRNGQRAALKILHLAFARDKAVCERFLRESYVSNKIGHAACVRVLDDDVTEAGEPYLVMELLEGETVRDWWKRIGRRVPVVDALKLAERILDCLVACHDTGVIHRDLKPANIFITHAGVVKILDFGVAQVREAAGEMTATGTALGTPAYMSPEQAMGLVDQLDGRTDLFSVGAMIHALSTGRRINHGRTENEALIMAATTPVPSVARIAPDLPVELIKIIDKALAWDRRNRFADAREMQSAVVDAIGWLGGELTPGMTPAADRAGAPSMAPTVPPPPIEETVAEDDPRVQQVKDLFRQVDRVLPSVRQLGWEHPATERTLRTAFEAFVEALGKDADLGRVGIRPYSLLWRGHAIWEPGPPFDAVPYNLFACGMRDLELAPTITLDEMRALFTLWLLDPVKDLPPEDDLAAAFWERGLVHVKYDVVDAFAEGDAAAREAFYDEADQMEHMAAAAARLHVDRIEAKAMAISTDRSALENAKGPSAMALDGVVRAVYATQLEIPRDRWSERYVDALVDGYIDAAFSRDAALVLSSLRSSAADLVVASRLDVVLTLHGALVERLQQRVAGNDLAKLTGALTNALFGSEALELALSYLKTQPEQVPAFDAVLQSLATKELPTVLGTLRGGVDEPLRSALLRYLERALPGREGEIGGAATGLEPDTAVQLLAMLARANTQAAKEVLATLAQSEDVNVRVEARVLGAGPEHAHAEVNSMLDSGSALVRMAALRAIRSHALKGAFPTVSRHVKAPGFPELGSDERKELLRTLLTLSVDHGEIVALELLKKTGMFVSQSREGSRISAAEILGELSVSPMAVEALREVGKGRWGTSEETRAAANGAVAAIGARLARTGSTPAPQGTPA
jgi:eukaryotic-like serine/threonine-protein kinase